MTAAIERNDIITRAKSSSERNEAAAVSYPGAHDARRNSLIENARSGLRKYPGWTGENSPQTHNDALRGFAESDFILLRVRRMRALGAGGDAFRVENDWVVEHRDATQPVPEMAAHGSAMF